MKKYFVLIVFINNFIYFNNFISKKQKIHYKKNKIKIKKNRKKNKKPLKTLNKNFINNRIKFFYNIIINTQEIGGTNNYHLIKKIFLTIGIIIIVILGIYWINNKYTDQIFIKIYKNNDYHVGLIKNTLIIPSEFLIKTTIINENLFNNIKNVLNNVAQNYKKLNFNQFTEDLFNNQSHEVYLYKIKNDLMNKINNLLQIINKNYSNKILIEKNTDNIHKSLEKYYKKDQDKYILTGTNLFFNFDENNESRINIFYKNNIILTIINFNKKEFQLEYFINSLLLIQHSSNNINYQCNIPVYNNFQRSNISLFSLTK